MPVGVSAYVPLANLTLSSSAASVTFSSISQAYRDLVLVMSATSPEPYIQFNNDTGSNYNFLWMLGMDAAYSGSSTSQTSAALARVAWGGNVVASIMDYSATDKHKTFLSRANGAGVGNNAVEAIAGRWASTSAISTVKVLGFGGGTFPAGSSFALYGIAS